MFQHNAAQYVKPFTPDGQLYPAHRAPSRIASTLFTSCRLAYMLCHSFRRVRLFRLAFVMHYPVSGLFAGFVHAEVYTEVSNTLGLCHLYPQASYTPFKLAVMLFTSFRRAVMLCNTDGLACWCILVPRCPTQLAWPPGTGRLQLRQLPPTPTLQLRAATCYLQLP